jgi:hypothetical protein
VDAQATTSAKRSRERTWWLRTLAVFQSPTSTFAALRDDSSEDADARQEPVLALMWLAGIAGVLAFGATTATLLDASVSTEFLSQPARLDPLEAAVFIFLAGVLYGIAAYWIGGGALHLGLRAAGGAGTYRQARHIVAFAAAPLVLLLVTVWPLRLAVYGGDLFRSGGADDGGADRWAFEAAELTLATWAAALLVLGVRAVHGWSLPRSAGAVVVAVLALFAVGWTFNAV